MKNKVRLFERFKDEIADEFLYTEIPSASTTTQARLLELPAKIKDTNIIAVEGKLSQKFFRVDGQVVKVTKRYGKIPIQGITEQGELVEFIGKFLEAVRVLRELWFIIKRLFV